MYQNNFKISVCLENEMGIVAENIKFSRLIFFES